MTKNRLTALLILLICSLLIAAPQPASAEGTSAEVINTRDDSARYRLVLQIRRALGDRVDTTNLAYAEASCESCRTVAVALQGLLVMGYPTVVAPENYAIAKNVDCQSCETLAIASQFLLQTGGPARLTGEGNRRIAAIRQEVQSLRRAGLSIEEIEARVQQLNEELVQVLMTEVVDTGHSDSSGGVPSTPRSDTPDPSAASSSPASGAATAGTGASPGESRTSDDTSDPGATGGATSTDDGATTGTETTTDDAAPTPDSSGTATTTAPTTETTTTTTPTP